MLFILGLGTIPASQLLLNQRQPLPAAFFNEPLPHMIFADRKQIENQHAETDDHVNKDQRFRPNMNSHGTRSLLRRPDLLHPPISFL